MCWSSSCSSSIQEKGDKAGVILWQYLPASCGWPWNGAELLDGCFAVPRTEMHACTLNGVPSTRSSETWFVETSFMMT